MGFVITRAGETISYGHGRVSTAKDYEKEGQGRNRNRGDPQPWSRDGWNLRDGASLGVVAGSTARPPAKGVLLFGGYAYPDDDFGPLSVP